MTNGTTILWNGNLATEPRTGTVEKVEGGLVHILWNDGKRQSVPSFTILPAYGWRVS